jgi:hypothetical protein
MFVVQPLVKRVAPSAGLRREFLASLERARIYILYSMFTVLEPSKIGLRTRPYTRKVTT